MFGTFLLHKPESKSQCAAKPGENKIHEKFIDAGCSSTYG